MNRGEFFPVLEKRCVEIIACGENALSGLRELRKAFVKTMLMICDILM